MSTRPDSNGHIIKRRKDGLQDAKQVQIHLENIEDGTPPFHTVQNGTSMNEISEVHIPDSSTEDIELRLRESEARYRSLISATAQIVWITDQTGHRASDLTAWCAYTGQVLAETDGVDIMNAIHPDDRPYVNKLWYHATKTKQTYEAEYRLRRHDGVYRMFNSRAVPVFETDGSVREWVGINTDITERKQLEAHLQLSETRFRLMSEQASIGMVFATLPGDYLLQANQCFCNMIGYTKEELLNQPALSLTHPDDAPFTRKALEQLTNGVQSCTIEKRYIRKDGSILWANVTMSAINDTLDAHPHYLAVIEDITERKRIQQEAMQHENELEAMVMSMTDGLIFFNKEGQLLRANPAARQIFGMDTYSDYFSRSLLSRASLFTVHDEHGRLISGDTLPTSRILHGELLAGENILDLTFHMPDNREVLVSISGSPVYDDNGDITNGVLIARDVTQHRHMEHRTHVALEGLLSMAEALIQLPENTDDMRLIGRRLADLTCDILDCQRVGILVIEPVTEIIRPIGVAGLSSEQEQMWWREQEQHRSSLKDSQNQTPELVAHLRNKDVVIIDMSQPPFSDAPNPYNISMMLVAPMYINDRLTGFLTLDYGVNAHIYTPNEVSLASAVGKLLALVVERQRLLTERAEARGREVALREANSRMEEFLGIASHELRTPLTTIKANVQLAKRRLRALMTDEDISPSLIEKIIPPQDMLIRAERQATVLNRLVGDLIDISRIQTGKLQVHLRPEPTNLMELVTETVEEQCKAYPNRIITLSISPTTTAQSVLVNADPDRIAQVITNYMSNALKYSSFDKPVEVSLEHIEQTAETPLICVAVRDQGPGLSREEQQRIWECFYQSSDVKVVSGSGVGLGLGLYISQTIVERHNGRVGVDSTPGAGSTFWFTLPVASTTTSEE